MGALARVIDPELHRPITDLGMVSSVDIAEDGVVSVEVLLTVAGCPLKDTITADTRREVGTVEGVTEVQVSLGVMNDEQKAELRRRLRGGAAEPVVPFTQPGNLTRVYAVTSGKGGVGKSSVTANLAAATAAHPDDAGEAAKVAAQQLHSWPGNSISGFDSNLLSVVGLVFGLGFVLSFGYWTTNFVEVQRAMASDSISSAQSTPIIGTFVKMFVPFLVIVPGMVAGVMVSEIQQLKADSGAGYQFNDAVLYLMRDLLPNGLLGLAITGLLASFMAGMAANISAFNTVWGVDIYQHYIKKNADDAHYLMVGKLSTLTASVVAILTAIIASSYSNLMDYLQTLFSMFNAPLFATFIIGMFWKRATPHAGWIGLISGTLGALGVNILIWTKHLVMPGQGGAFLAAGVAFTVDVVITVLVSMATKPKPDSELKGFVYALTPKSERTDPHLHELPWYRRPIPLGIIAGVLVIALNSIFH